MVKKQIDRTRNKKKMYYFEVFAFLKLILKLLKLQHNGADSHKFQKRFNLRPKNVILGPFRGDKRN
jgi:hypothetical protein